MGVALSDLSWDVGGGCSQPFGQVHEWSPAPPSPGVPTLTLSSQHTMGFPLLLCSTYTRAAGRKSQQLLFSSNCSYFRPCDYSKTHPRRGNLSKPSPLTGTDCASMVTANVYRGFGGVRGHTASVISGTAQPPEAQKVELTHS